jgi:phosphatidate cytidylyltransferase
VPVLRQRLILGPILIALIVLGVWLDEAIDDLPTPDRLDWIPGMSETFPPGVIALLVCVLLCIFGTLELARILRDKGIGVSKRVMSLSATTGLVTQALVPSQVDGVTGFALASMIATMVLSAALAFHSRNRTVEGVVAAAGGTLLAFVYLGLMLGFVVAIRREHSGWTLLWVLVTTKSCDIGAYFTGRAIGRHKLIQWLSPGKTWEGFFGGVLFAGVVGGIGAWVLSEVGVNSPSSIAIGALAGLAFGMVGQAGDLIASLFKRDAGIKDAGHVLPGFGGVLDVLDSLLLALPVAYWILKAGA